MVEALAAKNSEIEALVNSMDALKKQAAFSEGNLASMQVHHTPMFLMNDLLAFPLWLDIWNNRLNYTHSDFICLDPCW